LRPGGGPPGTRSGGHREPRTAPQDDRYPTSPRRSRAPDADPIINEMRLHVLVNGSAGSVVDQEQTVDAIAVAFRKAGVDIDGELTVQVAVVDAARLGEAAEA